MFIPKKSEINPVRDDTIRGIKTLQNPMHTWLRRGSIKLNEPYIWVGIYRTMLPIEEEKNVSHCVMCCVCSECDGIGFM